MRRFKTKDINKAFLVVKELETATEEYLRNSGLTSESPEVSKLKSSFDRLHTSIKKVDFTRFIDLLTATIKLIEAIFK